MLDNPLADPKCAYEGFCHHPPGLARLLLLKETQSEPPWVCHGHKTEALVHVRTDALTIPKTTSCSRFIFAENRAKTLRQQHLQALVQIQVMVLCLLKLFCQFSPENMSFKGQ